MSTWPEHATCVGAGLKAVSPLHTVAPHGWDDLLPFGSDAIPSERALLLPAATCQRAAEPGGSVHLCQGFLDALFLQRCVGAC
ncbi:MULTISPECIES: hypothetical protein [unclassified Variovorax]|uniref:hypothetical protein n=1 Tax=Variovorax TaxID=34072 RepID=UPI0014778372